MKEPNWKQTGIFADREDAGRQLVKELRSLELRDPLVLAIPRGGVVVGAVLARELSADLDVVLARKLRAPDQPELAIGAIGEDGEICFNRHAELAGLTEQSQIERERKHQLQEIARRQILFRAVRSKAPTHGRSVILTDDGIATGSTMIAALHVVKTQRPHEVIVAVPVASPHRLQTIGVLCDRLICLLSPWKFYAVGQFYRSFKPVEDEQVVRLLQEFAPITSPDNTPK
jgi:putative phosphoribosyl transferase